MKIERRVLMFVLENTLKTADIIALIVVAIILVFVIIYLFRHRGKCASCQGVANCPFHKDCAQKRKLRKKK